MGDSFITIVAFFLVAILLFVVPVITMSNRVDDVVQLDVETITSDFVNQIQTKGIISYEGYDSFIQELDSTGNTYDVTMEYEKGRVIKIYVE